jgi:transcriptional regulator with XRE-family HTH domain
VRLREMREKRGLSQMALAVRAGLYPGHISVLERELRGAAKLTTLERLAKALRCSVVDLLDDRYHRIPQ